jgi:hypothetical protein
MRTRTKRTQGTESPDAFIRLNMRTVRVAHFSFITQVERQLCIVNRGYAIVTKQQCGDQTNKFRSTSAMSSAEGKGSCLLELRSISSAVETVPGEFHVL